MQRQAGLACAAWIRFLMAPKTLLYAPTPHSRSCADPHLSLGRMLKPPLRLSASKLEAGETHSIIVSVSCLVIT
jgi:hypothetical protein